MKHTLPGFLLAASVAAGSYAASPFVSLYLMGQALRQGDVATLCDDVSWTQVREGLKEDIANGMTGAPYGAANTTDVSSSNDDLPAFGASFVSGLAGSVVDRTVTPQHLAGFLSTLHAAGASARPRMLSAHFTSATSFEVAFRTPQERATDAPLRLRLDLAAGRGGMGWVVTRAWVPEAILSQSETHAS